MPFYDYQCSECKHTEERLEPISKEPQTEECPVCKAKALTRIISRISFALAGGGWYNDGYDKCGHLDL